MLDLQEGIGLTEKSPVVQLHDLIHEYVQRHPIHKEFPRKTCAELSQYLSKDPVAESLVKSSTKDFDNFSLYPKRPMIQLSGFHDAEPTVWLLGWRAGEMTPVHDHAGSEVGITVLEGSVTETIYVPESKIEREGESTDYKVVQRELLEGSTVRIVAPYVHLFQKTCEGHDCVHATTIHCYWPRLLTMNFFEEKGGRLWYNGVWKDEG
jgi:hypothetical protein